MLTGDHHLTLDATYRVRLPDTWLADFGRTAILVPRDGAWRLYGARAWAELAALPDPSPRLHRMLVGSRRVRIDRQGHLTVPPMLRRARRYRAPTHAHLLGCGGYADLFDHAYMDARTTKLEPTR